MRKISAEFSIIACLVFVTGCSKSPKDEALEGFYKGCYVAENKELKSICDCAIDKMDKEFDEKFFKGDITQGKIMAFQRRSLELAQQCKNEL